MATVYSDSQFRTIFQTPFNLSEWTDILRVFFKAKELKVTPEAVATTDETTAGYYLGNIDTKDSYRIGLFHYEIKRGSVANKLVGLRHLVRTFINPNWGEFDAALVTFDSGDHWRLSFISDIKGEETHPKRYSYVFGNPGLRYNTPLERFALLSKEGITFSSLRKAFSVEALSDKFFEAYREHYADFVQYVTGKRFVKVGSKWEERTVCDPCVSLYQAFREDDKKVRDYIKKMLGRITFLHFLQRKGWMNGDLNYMQNLFERSTQKDNFLDAVLEPLFFGILNTKPEQRQKLFEDKNWNLSLLEEWRDIPYLNGGLFEQDEEDEPESIFPAELFNELFNFFGEYNFTIDENDPRDAEIGVDPEMLGKIFENLLEDNKDKGAFYTPKEIVQYMCEEALIAYLTKNSNIAIDKIHNFVVHPEEENEFSQAQIDKLLKLLKSVKICDPAIGSGAFPMGLLNVLIKCREALGDLYSGRAELKKSIISSNIYGVDIEKGAVDIARLRFWLSIVVEEKNPSPLPNLDFKIMQGNSLIEEYDGVDLSHLSYQGTGKKLELHAELWGDPTTNMQKSVSLLLSEYYSCFDHEVKYEKQKRIQELVYKQLEAKHIKSSIIDSLKKTDISATNKFFLWHTWFADVFENGGFDIVIGNPPYFVYNGKNKEAISTFKNIPAYQIAFGGKLNAYKLFLANALKVLVKASGVTCFIFQNSFLADLQAANLRKYTLSECQLLTIDSFPERDNKKKRVFESVKMSVCIVLLRKEHSSKPFTLNVWDDKAKSSGITTSFSYKEIESIDPIGFTIPRLREEMKPIIIKMKRKKAIRVVCKEGELNMTFHRGYFTNNTSYPVIMKGAGIQRYFHTHKMSQGTIEYLNEAAYLQDNGSTDKSMHHTERRIAMQGMTGANDKRRLIMTIVPAGIYLANSCNYIMPQPEIPLESLLAILNSKLANAFFRCFSTNSNVNGYEVENIPVPEMSKETSGLLAEKASILLELNKLGRNLDSSKIEAEIDTIVYSLFGLDEKEISFIEESY